MRMDHNGLVITCISRLVYYGHFMGLSVGLLISLRFTTGFCTFSFVGFSISSIFDRIITF